MISGSLFVQNGSTKFAYTIKFRSSPEDPDRIQGNTSEVGSERNLRTPRNEESTCPLWCDVVVIKRYCVTLKR